MDLRSGLLDLKGNCAFALKGAFASEDSGHDVEGLVAVGSHAAAESLDTVRDVVAGGSEILRK